MVPVGQNDMDNEAKGLGTSPTDAFVTLAAS